MRLRADLHAAPSGRSALPRPQAISQPARQQLGHPPADGRPRSRDEHGAGGREAWQRQHVGPSRRCVAARSASSSIPLTQDDAGSGGRDVQADQTQGSPAVASVRGLLFYLWTFALAFPLFAVMLVQAPFVALFDKYRRSAQHFVNNIWAKVSTRLFYRVKITGREHLPAPNEPAVYVANHQSFLDIYTLFHLNRSFKFISKTSNFLIPIVGWSMFLTGHVRLNRVDRRSQLACLSTCRELLSKGVSVLFFPEGTRATDMRLQEFKKGAFSVAAKAKVKVVPITLIGTGRRMPNKQESRLFPGDVEVVVHPPIGPAPADELLSKSREAIRSSLPPEMQPRAA